MDLIKINDPWTKRSVVDVQYKLLSTFSQKRDKNVIFVIKMTKIYYGYFLNISFNHKFLNEFACGNAWRYTVFLSFLK